jgi:hypothetical protein
LVLLRSVYGYAYRDKKVVGVFPRFCANPEQDSYNMGIERIGSLSGRYQVYRDPYAPATLSSLDTKENHC